MYVKKSRVTALTLKMFDTVTVGGRGIISIDQNRDKRCEVEGEESENVLTLRAGDS